MTLQRFVLIAGIASILISCAGATDVAPSTQPTTRPDSDKVKALRLDVAALEKQAYAKDPLLELAESYISSSKAANSKMQSDRVKVYKYLDEKKAIPQARVLSTAWETSVHIELIRDQSWAMLLKYFLTCSEGRKMQLANDLKKVFPDTTNEDLSNSEVFWRIYSEKLLGSEEAIRAQIISQANESDFPQYVIEQIKTDTVQSVKTSVCNIYLIHASPPELPAARLRLKQAIIDDALRVKREGPQ